MQAAGPAQQDPHRTLCHKLGGCCMAAAAVMQTRTPLQKGDTNYRETVDHANRAQPPSLSAPTCQGCGGGILGTSAGHYSQAYTVTARPHATCHGTQVGVHGKGGWQPPNAAAATAGSHRSGVSRLCNVSFGGSNQVKRPRASQNHQSAAEGLLGSKCSQQNRLLEHQLANQLQHHTAESAMQSTRHQRHPRLPGRTQGGLPACAAVGAANTPLPHASGAGVRVTLFPLVPVSDNMNATDGTEIRRFLQAACCIPAARMPQQGVRTDVRRSTAPCTAQRSDMLSR